MEIMEIDLHIGSIKSHKSRWLQNHHFLVAGGAAEGGRGSWPWSGHERFGAGAGGAWPQNGWFIMAYPSYKGKDGCFIWFVMVGLIMKWDTQVVFFLGISLEPSGIYNKQQ